MSGIDLGGDCVPDFVTDAVRKLWHKGDRKHSSLFTAAIDSIVLKKKEMAFWKLLLLALEEFLQQIFRIQVLLKNIQLGTQEAFLGQTEGGRVG